MNPGMKRLSSCTSQSEYCSQGVSRSAYWRPLLQCVLVFLRASSRAQNNCPVRVRHQKQMTSHFNCSSECCPQWCYCTWKSVCPLASAISLSQWLVTDGDHAWEWERRSTCKLSVAPFGSVSPSPKQTSTANAAPVQLFISTLFNPHSDTLLLNLTHGLFADPTRDRLHSFLFL